MADLVGPDGAEYEISDDELPAALEQGYRLKADMGGYTPEPLAQPLPEPDPSLTGRMVDLIGPDGETYEIDESEAQAAIEQGYKQPLLDKIYGGAEALVRGVTGGLSDLAQTASEAVAATLTQGFARGEGYQVDENAGAKAAAEKYQEIQARKERTGGLATGLEAGGAVVGALAPSGLLGQGVAGAARYTPPAVISSLAARAAGGLGGATVKGRIGQAVAAGALESAMDSASRRVIDDLAAGNYQISAERMAGGFSNVLEDAALGGLVGGVAGGLIEGSAAAYRTARAGAGKLAGSFAKAGEELAQPTKYNVDIELATQNPHAVAEGMGPLTAQELGNVADEISNGQASKFLAAARGAADEFGDTQQGAVKAISDDLTGFFEDMQDLRDVAGREAKRKFIRQLPQYAPTRVRNPVTNEIEMATPAVDFSAALAQIDNTERVLKERMDNIPQAYLGGSGAALKQAEEAAAQTRQLIMDAYTGKVDPADVVDALDQYKSFLQRGAHVKNPMVQKILKTESENWRLHLEDSSIYGDFGTFQKTLNAPITEGIAAEMDDAIRGFSKQGSVQSEFDPFVRHDRANEQHIGSFLNALGKNEIRGDEAAFRKFLRMRVIDAKTRGALYGDPALQALADRMALRAGRIEDSINAVALKARDKAAWEKFSSSASRVRDVAAISPFGTGPAGLAVAGVAQAVQSKGFMSAVARAAKKAAELEHSLAAASEDAVRTTMQGKAARAGSMSAATAGAVKRAIEQARALQDPDSPDSSRLKMLKEEIAADDPMFADVAAEQVKARAKFLADKAGPAVDASDPFGPRPALQSRPEQAALERYAQAAVAPANALRRLGAGQGTAEDLETLRTLYPALYQDFVDRIAAKMGGQNPSVRQRQMLHRITGIPAGRLMTPESVTWLQQVANAPPEPAQPAPGPAPAGAFDPDAVAVRSDTLLSGK